MYFASFICNHQVRTRHLEKFLQPYLDSLSVRIKWVDDAHALAIFCTSDLGTFINKKFAY